MPPPPTALAHSRPSLDIILTAATDEYRAGGVRVYVNTGIFIFLILRYFRYYRFCEISVYSIFPGLYILQNIKLTKHKSTTHMMRVTYSLQCEQLFTNRIPYLLVKYNCHISTWYKNKCLLNLIFFFYYSIFRLLFGIQRYTLANLRFTGISVYLFGAKSPL